MPLEKPGSQQDYLKVVSPGELDLNWRAPSFQAHIQESSDEVLYCRKIRIYPNKEQTLLFNKCLGATRYFYNQANAYIKNNGFIGFQQLRAAVMLSNKEIEADHPELLWQTEVPYNTRQLAIKELVSAYKSSFALKQQGYIESFDIGFKAKKAPRQVFAVDTQSFNPQTQSLFKRKLGKKAKLRSRKRDGETFLENHADKDLTILKIKPDKWYICLPKVKMREPPQAPSYESVFLDPGVRTFLTLYSPEGVCGKIGDGFHKQLQGLAERIDHLTSEAQHTESRSKTRAHLKARCARLRDKLKNKVNDLHWHACSLLCKGFGNIFLPDFRVSGMVPKWTRNIRSKTVRRMLELSHGRFRERLAYYAKTKHRNLVLVPEHYTSKTCGACGALCEVGGSRTFRCAECELVIDRDCHAARNICQLVLTCC